MPPRLCYPRFGILTYERQIMAELLRGRPALTIEWRASLGLDLLETASLVSIVHDFEGLGTWLVEAASTIPPRLRRDFDMVLRLTNYPQAVIESVATAVLGDDAPGHADADALFADLAALDAPTCQRMIGNILLKSVQRHTLPIPTPPEELLADVERLEQALRDIHAPVDHVEAAQLLRSPTEWRDLLVSSLQRFWERVYRNQWQRTRAQLARNVEFHRHQTYTGDIAAIFTAVTGRQIPDRVRPQLLQVEHVRFVPSLYLGPYVSVLFHGSSATIFYNGEGTPVADALPRVPIDDLYHPLTALADKTRLTIVAMLDGTELYAQEIVDRLGISQSAVSRHLQLMVDMKVLNVRRGERGAKFYSINTATLQRVAQHLREFR